MTERWIDEYRAAVDDYVGTSRLAGYDHARYLLGLADDAHEAANISAVTAARQALDDLVITGRCLECGATVAPVRRDPAVIGYDYMECERCGWTDDDDDDDHA